MTMQTYTIGRGKLLFRPEDSSTQGFDDCGNVTDFKLSFKTEKKEHYCYRNGLKVKDQEIILSVEANLSFVCDSLTVKNLKQFLLADKEDITQGAGEIDETITVMQDQWFKLGKYNISDITVKNHADSTITYEEGTDYVLDKDAGLIYIMPEGNIQDNAQIDITGNYGSYTGSKLQAVKKSKLKGRILFVADPPVGTIIDVEGDVELYPKGDLELIKDDYINVAFEGSFIKPQEIQHLYEVIIRGNR